MADKEADSSKLDISLLRTPIQISGTPIEQVLNSIHYGSPELRCLLMDECDLIFECKVCRALFRDLPNFISHKRAYCTKSALETRHVTIASLPEEKVVIIQPQAPEETSSGLSSAPQNPKPVRANLEQTIMRIQSGELGRSEAYKVYTEAAEKLQRQKEGMKVATIRTTAIATNKNAVFIDVNMASVNIHERQQQVNNGIVTGYEQKRNDNSVTVIKRKTGERHSNTRNVRKSAKQERPSSEPQKLLMEQLKEIQHKVKQKVAAAHDKTAQQKKVRLAPQNTSSQKDTVPPTTDSSQKIPVNTNTTRAQKKLANSSGLKVLSSDNVQSAAASDEETKGNCKDESDPEEVKYALVKHKVDNKIRSKAAKENKLRTAIAVTAATRRKKLSKRVPVCSKCNSVFATNKSLHYHEQIHHSGKRTFYPCPYCSSMFYYFFGITRHLFRNHSKSLEEINAMRRQLREMSFTKPLSASLCTIEGNESILGSGRSTRSLVRSHLLNLFPGTPSPAETSTSSDKQLSKKTSADGGDSLEATFKFTRHKIPQENNTQKEHLTSSKFSGSKTEDVVSAKEDRGEARPIRIKNRQQLTPGDNTGKPGNKLIGSPVRVSSPVSSSPIISRSQDNTSHLCPKCHRAFRRKISCKNHIKLCKAKGNSTQKPVRTPNTRPKSQQLTPESVNFVNSNKQAKMKNKNKTNNQDATEKVMVTTDNQSKSPVKIPENKDENVVVQDESSERKTRLRNSQVSSIDTITSLVQRSSSVDRLVTNDQPRNRSRERNSAARDERDSSVESTQSNMEGKSPRSHRNVLSRYATLAQLSKSPSKMDTSVKSDLSNESCDKFSDSQQVDTGENSSEARDTYKTSRGDIDNLNSEITPTDTSDGRDLCMPASSVKTRPSTVRNTVAENISNHAQDEAHPTENHTKLGEDINHAQDEAHPTENHTKLGEDINHAASLSETSLLSLVTSNRSPEKQQDSQLSSRYSPHKPSPKGSSPSADKLPGSVDRSDPLPGMSLDSCKLEVKENTCDVSTSAVTSEVIDIVEDKPETDLDACVKSEELKFDVDSDSKQDAKDLVTDAGETLEIAASDHKTSENKQSVQQDVQLVVADCDRKSTENDLNVQQKLQLGNPEYKQESSESLSEKEATVEREDQGKEELPIKLQTEFHSETIDMTVEENQALDLKKPDVISKEQIVSEIKKNSGSSGNVKTTSGNSKNKDLKTHNLPPVAVISALSERPKRKRKVPSRNKDAEEMLSKIHNHNRDIAPTKKAKIIHEIKASESPKKKLKAENKKTETNSVPEVDKNVEHAKDEPGTHAKNRRLHQKDESPELEYADDDSDEMLGKGKGRFVSNRMYVLEKCGSKNKRLKCYDQMKVFKMIDEEQLKCLECGESCTQVCNLRRHVIRQHLKWSRFKCKLCKFESYDRSECATHLIRGHKNRAITLRTVNQFILDLVRQGSHARSLKKNETIKVKQKSESQEGNIYARPTVKKTLRLPQKADDETSPRSISEENTGSRWIKSATELPQVWAIEELEPTSNSSESITSIVTASNKLTSSSTSPQKAETQSKQPAQPHISSKAGLEAAGKGIRKTLPFNISTRNSPRTFDTRPYNSVSDSASAETSDCKKKLQPITGKVNSHEEIVFPSQKLEIETGISRQKIQPITGKGNIQKTIVLPSGKSSQKSAARSNDSLGKDVLKSGSDLVSPTLVESSITDSSQKSRNIFEHINLQTTSSASAVSSIVTTTTPVSEPALSSRQELSVTSSLLHQNPSTRIIEVKVESPKNLVSVSSGRLLSQKLPSPHKKATSVKTEKSKLVSYVFRGPQLSTVKVPSDTVNSDQLGKSLIKLEFGDQVSLPGTSVSPSQPIAKLNLPPGKFTSAQVIDCANLQRKHMSIPSSGAAKISPTDTLKVTQRSAGISKETAGSSSGLSLAAALTKGGHIFTTVATSFIVSHGQAGKFIVYTRPAGAKDSTTVSSVTKQSPVPSPSSFTSTATDVKTLDANPQKDSQGVVAEDVLSPGTFVISKHYL